MRHHGIPTAPLLFALLTACSLMTGCTLQTTATPVAEPGAHLTGTVYGGSIPIQSAKVYLLAVNTTGYGGNGIAPSSTNASLSLLNPTSTGNGSDTIGSYVLTDDTGKFNVAADYNCSTGYDQNTGSSVSLPGNEQVYLYALGGNTGSGSVNSFAGLLAALGPCNAPTTTKIEMNEVTTVGTGYALAGFASDATHISSSGTALATANVARAFNNVGDLVSISTGTALSTTPAGNGTVPTATIYTLADILASCIDTTGGTASGTPCGTLTTWAQSSGASGTPPTDTATAIINLAHNPFPTTNAVGADNTGMTALFNLVTSTGAPFTDTLPGPNPPSDFTLQLSFTGGGLTGAANLAIDGSGNVFVANDYDSLSEFSSTGAPLSPSTGYVSSNIFYPNGIAIDANGAVWLADFYQSASQTSSSALAKLTISNGGLLSSQQFTGGGILYPSGVALDSSGNVYTCSSGNNTISVFSNSGSPLSPLTGANPFGGESLGSPCNPAIDASNNIWFSNSTSLNVSDIDITGSAITNYATYSSGFSSVTGANSITGPVAIDSSGNVFVADAQGYAISKITPGNSTPTLFRNGGLSYPVSVAIDGAGTVWASDNLSQGTISEFTNSGVQLSPNTGYVTTPGQGSTVAIDGAGDVWFANTGYVGEIIGSATPVVTPMVANLIAPYSAPASKP